MRKYILFLLPLLLGLLVSNDIEAKKKKYPNGDSYEGKWRDGAPNGNGKMTYANGNIYVGNWENGALNGNGKMIYANRDIYEGNWFYNDKHGEGKMIYANGDIYVGNWSSGNKHGNGKMIYANGDTYEESWNMGVRDGYGIMKYTNGDYFECNYSNGILVSGILSRANGDQYRVKWLEYKSGNGTINYKNGDVYVGDFKDLLPDGEGKLINKGGLEKSGKWEKGVLKNGQEERKGKLGTYKWNINEGEAINTNVITLEKGTTYKGEIENELPMGNGIFSTSYCFLDGFWENGKLTQIKEGSIKTAPYLSSTPAPHPITLNNGNLQILINYSDFTTEIKQYPNCEINQLPTLIRDVIYYIIDKNEPKKRKQEEQERVQKQQERLRKEEQLREEEQEKEKRLEEEKLKPLIQKYGIKHAKSILKKEVKIGMTAAMLDEMFYFWKKTKQTTANGVVEIWRNWRYYVTLVNGKVVKIVEE